MLKKSAVRSIIFQILWRYYGLKSRVFFDGLLTVRMLQSKLNNKNVFSQGERFRFPGVQPLRMGAASQLLRADETMFGERKLKGEHRTGKR